MDANVCRNILSALDNREVKLLDVDKFLREHSAEGDTPTRLALSLVSRQVSQVRPVWQQEMLRRVISKLLNELEQSHQNTDGSESRNSETTVS